MPRFTLEEVREAYRRNGFAPRNCAVRPDTHKACCALGALCDGKALSTMEAGRMLNFEYGCESFAIGFDAGWRRQTNSGKFAFNPEAYANGYEIGFALRAETKVICEG